MAWMSFKVPTLITRSADSAGDAHKTAVPSNPVNSNPDSFLAIVIASLHK
jgi:hypothetical protein